MGGGGDLHLHVKEAKIRYSVTRRTRKGKKGQRKDIVRLKAGTEKKDVSNGTVGWAREQIRGQ